jgi:methyl-accepting chemotaxis protein
MDNETKRQLLINKQLVLRLILEAKSSHVKWLAYALALIEGVDCSHECAPVSPKECEFGKWYYGEGKEILGDTECYHSLEAPHEMLHNLFENIYKLVDSGNLDEARKHVSSLREMSDILIEALDYLKEEIESLPPH